METVTEAKAGAEVEAVEQKSSTVETKAPEKEKVSSEEEPKYTQKQLDELVHVAKSEAGRERKAIEIERDQFKSKVEKLETQITDIQTERDKLQSDIEELSADDPKKFDIIKRDKELREIQRNLQTKADEISEKEKASEEKVKLANDTLLEISIWEIAAEYKTGDPVKLKDLCSTFGATSEEQIRKVADTMWEKEAAPPQTEQEKQEALKLVSGKTKGGSDNLGGLSPKDRVKEADKRLRAN